MDCDCNIILARMSSALARLAERTANPLTACDALRETPPWRTTNEALEAARAVLAESYPEPPALP